MQIGQLITKASALTLLILLQGCQKSEQQEVKAVEPLTVSTTKISLNPSYKVQREYVGTVKSGQQANLGFELSGKVEALYVDVGNVVEKGAPLIKLDTDLLATEANQLKAQNNEVRAQLKLVKANLKRQQSLKSKGFSAEAEIDALTSQEGVLQANLVRLQAAWNANKLKQEKSTIRAPYSGVIAKRRVSLGDVVNVGTPTLVLLASAGKEAFIGIPSQQLERITQLASPHVRVSNTHYDVTLLNPGAMVDTKSRSVSLRYQFPENAPVLEGELVYLAFEQTMDESGYWVPLTALIDGLRGVWNVYVIGTDNKVERRSVNVLYADSERAFINGSLADGEPIIASGLHRVVPGQPVLTSAQ
ncbi:efflux RND transporter periplasmic adaptor subunit [Vibrio thalassae]|nr:efflux RND transporter periplasmic adaptor subunit [Vibrio thalassae]